MSAADSSDRIRINRKWEPHEGQEPIDESDARFRAIAAGRRFGKTEYAGHELFEDGIETADGLFYWVAPTYDIADTGFHAVKRIIPEGVVENKKTSKPKQIDLINGTRIEFRSTDREDGLRSQGLDGVVLDEAAMIPKRAWTAELRPSLSDKLGWMIAISTPKGQNWFRDYYNRGQNDDEGDAHIASFKAPTAANPHIPESEIADARRELPERIFEQEYLAKFLDDSGGVFKSVRERVIDGDAENDNADAYEVAGYDGEPPYRTGVDFARQQNFTVVITLDATGRMVFWERVRQVGWPVIQDHIERAYEQYPGPVAVDASRDNKIVGDLQRAGVDVAPVNFSSSKTELVENLITTVEREELTLPNIQQLITELQVFEYDSTKRGNVRYRAPESFHDDAVDALALAEHAPTVADDGGGSGSATWGTGPRNAPGGTPGARATSDETDGERVIDLT